MSESFKQARDAAGNKYLAKNYTNNEPCPEAWFDGANWAYNWCLENDEFGKALEANVIIQQHLKQKLAVAIHSIADAIAESDCGEVSDFNLRQCLAVIKGESDEHNI